MEAKLLRLEIENLKGIKRFELDLGGENAVIVAENGVGKTTVYDSFLWLWFGKDSTGRKDFGLRPLDSDNNPIKGLVTAVEADLEYEGDIHTFRKEQHEKVTKGQMRGYETLCWIDAVPKKVGEYDKYIAEIIKEDTFKLLTDIHFFNSKMHWKERRQVLLEIAGDILRPEGFEGLIEALKGRSVDDYKKVLADEKKGYEKERDEINPRIDEIQRGLDNYAGSDVEAVKKQREVVTAEIANLDSKRKTLRESEQERQTMIDYVNGLKTNRANREAELISDTSAIASLIEEKVNLESLVAERKKTANEAGDKSAKLERSLTNKKSELEDYTTKLDKVRQEVDQLTNTKDDDTCHVCGQKLPADKIAEITANKNKSLSGLATKGNALKASVKACKDEIAELETKVNEANKELEKALERYKAAKESTAIKTANIDAKIKDRPDPDFTKDARWQEITANIAQAEKEIGEPVSKQLEELETQKEAKQSKLTELNNTLAQSDRMEKDKARIEELKDKEKQLAQGIANVDKQLADIERYKAAESSAIESAVNDKFKHVTFKLFNYLLNGSIEETCEATLNGVPYADMSCGQKIIVGVDIINVLSEHYSLSVPLFIDNAESLTLPLEANSQTIELYAKLGVESLTIEKKGN